MKSNDQLLFEAIYKDFRKSEFDTYVNEHNLIYQEIDYFLKHLNRLSKPEKVKTGLAVMPALGRFLIRNRYWRKATGGPGFKYPLYSKEKLKWIKRFM